MMRRVLLQLLLISLVSAWLAPAQSVPQAPQNSEISILFGPVSGSAEVTRTFVQASGKVSWQVNFAHTIHSYSFWDLWWEFPTTFVFRGNTSVGGLISTGSTNSSFSTPGVRLQIPAGSRVSFYAMTGAGLGIFSHDNVILSSGVKIETYRNYHGVFDFGGGADLRLTRLLSLRGEVRDFVTGKALGGTTGRNQVLADFGVVFHF